jgi:hypothetical protein
MTQGERYDWTCDICGFKDFDEEEEFFIGHRWDCLEEQEALEENIG